MATAYDYGFTNAILKANPDIAKVVAAAVKGNWSPTRFETALKDTAWWKKTQDTARAAFLEQKMDPASWTRKVNAQADAIAEIAAKLGGTVDAKALAAKALTYGWDEEELNEQVAGAIDWKKVGPGTVTATQAELVQMANDHGVRVSQDWAFGQAKELAKGNLQPEAVQQQIREWAAGTYGQWAEEIRAGRSVRELADPYIQSMSALLEVGSQDLSLIDDGLLRKALTSRDDKGQPVVPNLADFERQVREDPRWRQTKNAQQRVGQISAQVLADFGLTGMGRG